MLTVPQNRFWTRWAARTIQMFEAQVKLTLYPDRSGCWRIRAQVFRETYVSGDIWSDEDLDVQLREARLWVNRALPERL